MLAAGVSSPGCAGQVTLAIATAREVAADISWTEQAIGELTGYMRAEIEQIHVRELWSVRPLRENMIRQINLIKSLGLETIENLRAYREHLARESRMLPPQASACTRAPRVATIKVGDARSLNAALAGAEMELRVRWHMAQNRSRKLPRLVDAFQ
jgi:hypothetical protein